MYSKLSSHPYPLTTWFLSPDATNTNIILQEIIYADSSKCAHFNLPLFTQTIVYCVLKSYCFNLTLYWISIHVDNVKTSLIHFYSCIVKYLIVGTLFNQYLIEGHLGCFQSLSVTMLQ